MDNTANNHLLAQARHRATIATTLADKFRWLVIIAILEGSQCPTPGSSTSAKAS